MCGASIAYRVLEANPPKLSIYRFNIAYLWVFGYLAAQERDVQDIQRGSLLKEAITNSQLGHTSIP
jgi:hypothetical protein